MDETKRNDPAFSSTTQNAFLPTSTCLLQNPSPYYIISLSLSKLCPLSILLSISFYLLSVQNYTTTLSLSFYISCERNCKYTLTLYPVCLSFEPNWKFSLSLSLSLSLNFPCLCKNTPPSNTLHCSHSITHFIALTCADNFESWLSSLCLFNISHLYLVSEYLSGSFSHRPDIFIAIFPFHG